MKEMTDLALQSERHEHERTRARLDAVERVVLQANELANQLDRERQMHEATALDLANVLARERSVHDTMRQQLSQQQLDLQSAETQAARESTTQQRQLSERLGTCEAALARRDERIAPPGRWPRITTPTGRHAHGSSAFEIECVETPSVCACALWRVDNTQLPTLLYTLNEPQHTNTDSDLYVVNQNGIGARCYTGASTAPSTRRA